MSLLHKFRQGYDDDDAFLVHRCDLPQREDVVVYYIDVGWCIPLRRRLKQFSMVDGDNPRTRLFLKSWNAIRQEKMRHLEYYYYMIHPLSAFRKYWEAFMICVFIVSMVIIPVDMTASYFVKPFSLLRLCLDMACLLDCVLSFWTGYYNVNTHKIILDQKMAIKHYLRGHFMIDLIATLPYYKLPFVNRYHLRLLGFIKFIRICSLLTYLGRFKDSMEWSNVRHKTAKTFIIFFYIINVTTSMVFIANQLTLSHWSEECPPALALFRVFYSCFRGLCCVFMVEYGDVPHNNPAVLCGLAFGIQMGFIVQTYMLANIIQILGRFHSSRTKYQELIYRVRAYVMFKNLSTRMRDRLFAYFDYKYQSHFYDEQIIMETISPQLKQELMIVACTEFIERVDYFKQLPPALLLNIVKCLKTVVYLTDDVIVHAGYEGNAMYFINYGTVAVFTKDGKEVCHLSDGGHFGEIALLCEEKRVATVVALYPCELLQLSKSDFHNVMEPYPEHLNAMRQLAKIRLQEILRLVSMLDSNDPMARQAAYKRRATLLPQFD